MRETRGVKVRCRTAAIKVQGSVMFLTGRLGGFQVYVVRKLQAMMYM